MELEGNYNLVALSSRDFTDFEKVPTQLENWPEGEGTGVRQSSINNFGYGGANAHVVMQDYQSFIKLRAGKNIVNGAANGTNGVNGKHGSQPPRVIILSAKDEQSCQTMAANLKDYLVKPEFEDEEKLFANLAYTLGQRRSIFPWISALPVQNIPDLVKTIDSGRMKPTRRMERAPRLGYVFTGQGAQWFAMGRELIEAYPVFKACLEEADGYLKELGATWSLVGVYSSPEMGSQS